MGRSKVFIAFLAFGTIFLCGVFQLIIYSEQLLETSENVRPVHLIGLSGTGVMGGTSLVGLIAVLARKRTPTDAKKSTGEQPAL